MSQGRNGMSQESVDDILLVLSGRDIIDVDRGVLIRLLLLLVTAGQASEREECRQDLKCISHS